MKKALTGFLVLTATALLAACGGGSSDSSGATGSTSVEGGLSKPEWIAQADDICQRFQDEAAGPKSEFEALDLSFSSSKKDLSAAADLLREIDAKSEQELASLRELEAPSGDAELIDAMLTEVEESSDIGVEAADALEKGDEDELQKLLEEGNEVNGKAKKDARAYGLKVCGI